MNLPWGISIALALVLGVPAILLTIRSIRKIKIAYVQFDLISLIRTPIREIKDIKLSYKGEQIDPGIYLLRSALFNIGNNDIDKSIVHEPVEIVFPKGYEVLELSLEETPTHPNCQVIEKNKIRMEWDVFKRKECIPFNALLRISPEIIPERKYGEPAAKDISKELLTQIGFKERIANLEKIRKVRASEVNLVIYRQEKTLLYVYSALMAAVVIFVIVMSSITPLKKLAFRYEHFDHVERIVTLSSARNNQVKIKELKGTFRKVISSSDILPATIKGIEIIDSPESLWGIAAWMPVVAIQFLSALGAIISKVIMKRRYGMLISSFNR